MNIGCGNCHILDFIAKLQRALTAYWLGVDECCQHIGNCVYYHLKYNSLFEKPHSFSSYGLKSKKAKMFMLFLQKTYFREKFDVANFGLSDIKNLTEQNIKTPANLSPIFPFLI